MYSQREYMSRRWLVRALTPTSYAILSLLALRPYSAYDLIRQLERSLHYFWPRAESKLYEEPKALVAHGYATAERQPGTRPRTVYTITTDGRAALTRWLDVPGAGPVLEFEGMVKVFFAEQGTKAQLLATLDTIRAQAEVAVQQGVVFGQQYLAQSGPFPDRTHVNALVFDFLGAYTRMCAEWAQWAMAEVEQWPDVAPSPEAIARGLAIMRRTNEAATAATLNSSKSEEAGESEPRRDAHVGGGEL